MSDTWEVVGNTLYLRKPAPSAPSREHVDWIAFPGYAEAAHRICAERNKAVAALEARLAEVAPVVEAADRLVAEAVSERAKAFREVVAKLDSIQAATVSPARLAGLFETWADAAEGRA